jgi:uncharacterized membrane protein
VANRTLVATAALVVVAGAAAGASVYLRNQKPTVDWGGPKITPRSVQGPGVDARAVLTPAVCSILENADSMELRLLAAAATEPKVVKDEYPSAKTVELAPAQRKVALDAIYQSIAEGTGHGALCFEPHHVLHVVQGTQTVDLQICFECEWIRPIVSGAPAKDIPISRAAKARLNELLAAAK